MLLLHAFKFRTANQLVSRLGESRKFKRGQCKNQKGPEGMERGQYPHRRKERMRNEERTRKAVANSEKGSFTSILQRRSKVRLCPESVDISGHELRLHSDAFRSGSDATAGSPWLLISQPPPSRSRLAGQRRLGSPKGKRSGWPS